MDNFLCFPTYLDNINILISILASLSFFKAVVLHGNTGTVSHEQKVSCLSVEIHSAALTIAGTQSSPKINKLFHEWWSLKKLFLQICVLCPKNQVLCFPIHLNQ